MGFGLDICHCMSRECERWNECLRGKYADIMDTDKYYTASLLSNVCNSSNDYEDYIKLYEEEKETLEKCNR